VTIPKVVLDTCVAYKWLRPAGEKSVEEALAIAEAAAAGRLDVAAPSIMLVELTNILRYGGYSPEAAAGLLARFVEFHFEIHEPDEPRLAEALALAIRHDLTVYDALFLQLAEELECPLVTADRRAFAGVSSESEIRLL
jgi:predicted nucleic acid-binding protein